MLGSASLLISVSLAKVIKLFVSLRHETMYIDIMFVVWLSGSYS